MVFKSMKIDVLWVVINKVWYLITTEDAIDQFLNDLCPLCGSAYGDHIVFQRLEFGITTRVMKYLLCCPASDD